MLTPLLWLAAVASTEELIAACVLRDLPWALACLLAAACLTPAAAIAAFAWFMLTDPDRLDPASLRLAMKKLETKAPPGGRRPRTVAAEPPASEPEAMIEDTLE